MELPLVGNTRPTIQVDCEPNSHPSPHSRIWVCIINAVCGDLLHSYGSAKNRVARCLRDDLGVMLKVALGDFLSDPLGGKGDRRGVRAGSTSKRKSSLALEKGCFKHTEHCQVFRDVSILTEGMRNLNVYVGW